MTDQHDARDALKDLLYAHHVRPSCQAGASHINRCRCVSCATERASAIAATQPTKPEQQAGGAPEGFVLVPVEPTPEMLKAGVTAFQHAYSEADILSDWRACFKAMLAAAPSQSAVQPLSEQMLEGMKRDCDSMEMRGAYVNGWTSAERAHGIVTKEGS